MKRVLGLTAVAALLVGTMLAHRAMAFGSNDECTGTEVCTNAQVNTGVTCVTQQPNGPSFLIVGFTIIAPIVVAECCDDLADLLDDDDNFIRVDPIPNVANCCVFQANQVIQLPSQVSCAMLGF